MSFSSDNPILSNQVPVSLDVNPDEENYAETLMLYLRRMANSVNTKDQAIYVLQETGSFQQWFNDATPVKVSENRNGYRLTVDMVALNLLINAVTTIPAGTTTLQLTATAPITQPPPIRGYMFPTRGFGGALDTGGTSYFPSDPNITVTFMSSTNTFTIINNTGNALTQFYWVMEYLKN
jgi:hypothetical protein